VTYPTPNTVKSVSTHKDEELAAPLAMLAAAVEDTGHGLDPAIAQRIFEPLFTTKSDGLGMGLSICRSIIQAHGGELWAAARAPYGTAFGFTIRLAVEG
jgi:signal transduction histidine kinase